MTKYREMRYDDKGVQRSKRINNPRRVCSQLKTFIYKQNR